MWKTRPVWPASAAQVADWPRLAEARGSPEARSAPERGLRRASWPRSEPPCFPHSQALAGAQDGGVVVTVLQPLEHEHDPRGPALHHRLDPPQQPAVGGRLLELTRAQLAGRHRCGQLATGRRRRLQAQRTGGATCDQALDDRADTDADCDAHTEEEGALHATHGRYHRDGARRAVPAWGANPEHFRRLHKVTG